MFIFRDVKIPEKGKEIICCPHQVQTGQVFMDGGGGGGVGVVVKGVVKGI